jgi:hypothetical protein
MLFTDENGHRSGQQGRKVRHRHECAGSDYDQDEHDGAEAVLVEYRDELGQRLDDGDDDIRIERGHCILREKLLADV